MSYKSLLFNTGTKLIDIAPTGTGSDLTTATVTLTALQIKTIATTPVLVLPAPGANLTHMILQVLAHYRFGTMVYTLGSMTQLILSYTTFSNNGPWYVGNAVGFLDQTGDSYVHGTGFKTGYDNGGSPPSSPPQIVVNSPLYITADHNPVAAGSPPAFGDGTLTLTILYSTIDTTIR